MRTVPVSNSLFDDAPVEAEVTSDVVWTLDRAIAVFLNRWAFNWRGERTVIEQELRQLITDAKALR